MKYYNSLGKRNMPEGCINHGNSYYSQWHRGYSDGFQGELAGTSQQCTCPMCSKDYKKGYWDGIEDAIEDRNYQQFQNK